MTGNYGQQGRGNQTLFSVIATPVIIITLATVLLVTNLVSLIGVLVRGGEVVYEEEALNAYIGGVYDEYYKEIGGSSKNKDSGVVLIFFYNEDTNTIEYAVKSGSNVQAEATKVFGTENAFGKYLKEKLKMDEENFPEKFDETMAGAIKAMIAEVKDLELNNPYISKCDKDMLPSLVVIQDKGLEENEEQLPEKIFAPMPETQKALDQFKKEAGFSVVITLDTSENAIGRNIPLTDIFMVVLLVAVMALCTVNLIKKVRDYKRIKADFGDEDPSRIRVNARSPYYDEDDEDDEPASAEYDEDEEDDEEIVGASASEDEVVGEEANAEADEADEVADEDDTTEEESDEYDEADESDENSDDEEGDEDKE